jgi:uncharacterized protein (DUF1778 family)
MTATSRKPSPSRPKTGTPGETPQKTVRPKRVAKASAKAAKRKTTGVKRARLGVRLDDRVKVLLQHAASLRGRSMTDFLVDSAVEVAERVIKDASVISLGMEDARRFADVLLTPPKPNAALKSAALRYRELISA